MTPDPQRTPPEPAVGGLVSFTLDSPEVTVGRLGTLADELHGLLREVQTNFLPAGRVRWRVERISLSSPLVLESRPISEDVAVTGARLRELSSVVSNGLKQLQREARRPPYFTDEALEKARDIVTLVQRTESSLLVETTQLDERVVANINEVLGAVVTAIGSVEGRTESFNVHGSNRFFNIYDVLTGQRIRCDFAHRIPADEIGATAEKRVIVHGEIRYREDGQIVNVIARSIEVQPEEGDLPSADDVLGILGD